MIKHETEQFDSAIAIGNRCSNVSPMVIVAAIILSALWIHVPVSVVSRDVPRVAISFELSCASSELVCIFVNCETFLFLTNLLQWKFTSLL